MQQTKINRSSTIKPFQRRLDGILFFFVISGFCFPAMSHAENQKWYVSGTLGTHFSSDGDTQIPSIASKPPLTSEPVYNAGAFLGLSAGYQFSPFRVEGEFAYQHLPVKKINDAIGAGTVTYLTDSYTNFFSVFLNGFYDFKFTDRTLPYPYIGIGTGYVYVKNMIRPDPPIPVAPGTFFTKKELNYPAWGYQGIIGMMYQIKNNVFINLNYRYFATLNESARGQTNLGADGYTTKQKITTNIISLGVQYYF